MLSALLHGRALTATELAYAARVTPQTASAHLAKLAAAGLVAPIRDGRYRYFRLASPRVAEMLEGIMAVALEHRPRYRPLSRQARELSAARICYDHLAGRLSVALTDALVARRYVVLDDATAEITPAGARFLTRLGVGLPRGRETRRRVARLCLDWTERRPHIAGALAPRDARGAWRLVGRDDRRAAVALVMRLRSEGQRAPGRGIWQLTLAVA